MKMRNKRTRRESHWRVSVTKMLSLVGLRWNANRMLIHWRSSCTWWDTPASRSWANSAVHTHQLLQQSKPPYLYQLKQKLQEHTPEHITPQRCGYQILIITIRLTWYVACWIAGLWLAESQLLHHSLQRLHTLAALACHSHAFGWGFMFFTACPVKCIECFLCPVQFLLFARKFSQ